MLVMRVLAVVGILVSVLSILVGSEFSGPELRAGDYIVYRYELVYGERSVVGVFREEVVRGPVNGSVRLRLELSFNDGVATLEKDVPESFFIIPRCPMLSEGRFTYVRENVSFSLSVEGRGSEVVEVGGRSYLVNIYSIGLTVTHMEEDGEGGEAALSGVLELVNGSGVFYRAEASFTTGSGSSGRLFLQLTDTNIDLASFQVRQSHSAQLFSNYLRAFTGSPVELDATLMPLMALGGGAAEASSSSRVSEPPAAISSGEYFWRGVAVVSLGVAALVVAAAAPALIRRKRSSVERGVERKPYYV
ncbi:hypothetical protein HRbin02_01677 [Candidatus Calditenuaceae archaeon HR02]|nr:hypothetical protein HRbin02_01677 [Candidatus Calditenuaceae archaeon HR02]